MTALTFALIALSAYRVAVAISADLVFAPMRARVMKRWPHYINAAGDQEASWQAKLVHCARCLSVWTAIPFCLFVAAVGLASWAEAMLAWLAAAGAVVIAVRFIP